MRKQLASLVFLYSASLICFAQKDNRPNIILIMADDMGYGDVGFNGNEFIRTPNLDDLAETGIILNHFYSAAPLSSPTRASVLTGRHPFRMGVFSANVGILRKSENTISEILHYNGYRTGIFGKWHLGTLTYMEKDANRGSTEAQYLFNPPVWHGFDVSFVTESKVPTYDPMKQPIKNDGRFWNYLPDDHSTLPYGTYYWKDSGEKEIDSLDGNDAEIIVNKAIDFIKESHSDNRHFLCVIWFHAPHLPCVASPKASEIYKDLKLEEKSYYGSITDMDREIGKLRDFLIGEGIFNNSVIFFCSDNGPEIDTPGSAGKFRGRKRSLHEGGIRVPSFVCWKDSLPSHGIVDCVCSTMDYFPTILDITGVEFSLNQNILDGESLMSILQGKQKSRAMPIVLCSGNQGAVIDRNFKLYYSDGDYELYDIAVDPTEINNIINDFPVRAEELKDILVNKIDEYKVSFERSKSNDSYNWQIWHDIMNTKNTR